MPKVSNLDQQTTIALQNKVGSSRFLALPSNLIGDFQANGRGITGLSQTDFGDGGDAVSAAALASYLSEHPVSGDAVQLRADLAAPSTGVASGDGASLIQLPDFASLGLTPQRLDAAFATGELRVRTLGIHPDSATDWHLAINQLGDWVEAKGGGKIVFDRPDTPGSYYKITRPICGKDRVTFEGQDKSVLIRNTGIETDLAQVFHLNGVRQNRYQFFTRYALKSVAADSMTVEFNTHADASHFTVGQVVLIFSDGTDFNAGQAMQNGNPLNWAPFFSQQYRILDITAGVVTLDFPITQALTVSGTDFIPVMTDCRGLYWDDTNILPTRLVDQCTIRNLRIYSDDLTNGRPFTGGIYQGLIENVHVEKGRQLYGGNAMCRSVMRDISGVFSQRMLELATGSHDSQFYNFHGSYQTGTGAGASIMLLDEFSKNHTIDGWRIYAPNYFVTAPMSGTKTPTFMTFGPGSGHVIRNGWARFGANVTAGVGACKGISVSKQHYVATSNITINDVELSMKGQSTNFSVGQADTFAPSGIRVSRVTFSGDAPSSYGAFIDADGNLYFDDCNFNGILQISSGNAFTGEFDNCKFTGFGGNIGDLNKLDIRNSKRLGGDGFYSAKVLLTHQSVANTAVVGAPVVYSYTAPAGMNIDQKDQVQGSAIFTRTVGATGKTATFVLSLAKADGTGSTDVGTFTIADVTNGHNGCGDIGFTATVEGNTVLSVYMTAKYVVNGTTTVVAPQELRATGLDLAANGFQLNLKTYFDSTGGTSTTVFDAIDIRAKLYGE